jgi:organic radical activating enzyme
MPYCKALYNHIFFDINAGYKTCCNARPLKTFSIYDYTFEEFYNSDYFNEVRKTMETDWHPNCSMCKHNEDRGVASNRTIHNYIHHKSPQGTIDYIDFRFSNKCNLTCRMCNPNDSSKWGEVLEEEQRFKSIGTEMLEALPLQDVKKLSYLGGEPFLTKEIDYVIDKCLENNIKLHMVCNVTFFPKQKIIEKLKSLPYVHLAMSIDAYNSLNDYIRQGSNIETVKSVYKKWIELKENINLSINTVVQAYNVHCLGEIKNLGIKDKLFVNYLPVTGIPEFSLNALPPEYVDEIKNQSNERFFIGYKFDTKLFEKLKQTTRYHDRLFNTDLKQYNPLLAEYLDKYTVRS